MAVEGNPRSSVTASLLDPRAIDPDQELVDYSAMGDDEINQVVQVLEGVRRWREAEQAISFRSRTDMRLNETDMKALRFIVVAMNQGVIVTPGALAEHLNISTASTTKLLDRLAAAGHIQRSAHPTDRRALTITITKRTHEHVRDTVGRTHARRFDVAARLTPAEREVVIRFLNDLSHTGDTEQADKDQSDTDRPGVTPSVAPRTRPHQGSQ